jgi:5-deoxy-glucuronate isomerase
VPPGQSVAVRAVRDAPNWPVHCTRDDRQPRAVRLLDSATMKRSVRGKGSNTRYVCDILPHDDPTRRPPAGGGGADAGRPFVQLPAAQARRRDTAAETQLEETYYHRLNPPQGFAFQRVYTDDRSIDEACAVEDHDVVMVPRGYHPVVAARTATTCTTST